MKDRSPRSIHSLGEVLELGTSLIVALPCDQTGQLDLAHLITRFDELEAMARAISPSLHLLATELPPGHPERQQAAQLLRRFRLAGWIGGKAVQR